MSLWLLKCLVIAAALGAWFRTQAWLARRPLPEGLHDRVHELTAPLHRRLSEAPRAADALLVFTSALIDLAGLALLASAIFGESFGPFLGLLVLFALRQLCQGLCALPPPPGMIWRDPGVPSLLVTYGTANDLFFSGHTAIAVYAALEMARHFGAWGVAAGALFVLIEAATVLVLRAHYTLDVFAGAVTALAVWILVQQAAPAVDGWLALLAR
ncbi:MAG TPA: phosphatase PAP2-related protein [Burkholderiales bacterium]